MKESKYFPLQKHLQNLKSTSWHATFMDIETILGFTLPKSAYVYTAWWTNHVQNSRHSKAWMDIDWIVQDLCITNRTVTFKSTL